MENSSPASPDQEIVMTPVPGQVNMAGIRIGYAMGGVGWLACFLVASRLVPDDRLDATNAISLNILTCLFGSIVGWWFGILMSPDPTERGQFSSFRKAVSAFLSGFVLAKLDILFQGAVARNLTSSPLFMGRIALFATTVLICAQFTYVARHDLGMYGVRHFTKKDRDIAETSADRSAVRVRTSRVQSWLRIVGVLLALTGMCLLLYLNYLHTLEPAVNISIYIVVLSALVLFASTTTVREWLFGRNGTDKKT